MSATEKTNSSTAREINSKSKALEHKVESGMGTSRKALKSVYSAMDNSKDIADVEATLKQYLTLKSDARALQTYYRTNIAGLKPDHEDSKFSALDMELVAFEKNFAKFSNLTAEDQVTKLIGIVDAKDKATFRIAATVLEGIGMDHVVREYDVGCDLSLCSRELPNLFCLFETFRSLGKTVKRLISALDIDDQSADIVSKQLQIAHLQSELAAKEQEAFDLGNKLRQVTMNVGRQQIIARQLEEIQGLEARCKKTESELLKITRENRELQQDLHQRNDLVQKLLSQLDNAQQAYDTDVLKLQPLVERQISKAQSDHKEIVDIRNKVSLSVAMMDSMEKRAAEAKVEAAVLHEAKEALRIELLLKDDTIKQLERELGRQTRINLCIAAAKLKFEALANDKDLEIADQKRRYAQLEAEKGALRAEFSDLEAFVEELQEMVTKAEEAEKLTEEQLNIQVAVLAAKQLRLATVEAEVKALQAGGLSDEKQAEFDALEEEIAHLNKKLITTEQKLRVTTNKMYEMQTQLLEIQSSQF